MKNKIIFICTGNSCRSQIAERLLREEADDKFEVFSAGSNPSRLHPAAVKVMACLLYTSPSPRDATLSRMPSSA